jgi:aminoglycoside phosphotransferase (APT) family kinase protein
VSGGGEAPLVDGPGLARFLAERLPELSGPFRIERIGEGQSCLTFTVRGEGWEVVLRRPPRGDLPPSAFDVVREHRVISALTGSGAGVPVPRPLALCEDDAVIGAPFYLMELVEGVVARREVPAALGAPADRRLMGELMVDMLGALRAVDWRDAGLEGFGRPDGYLQRQLRRMGQLWELARFRPVPEIDEVGAWLAERVPDSPPAAVVHGDFKLDNLIFAPAPPTRVAAVIDWELSTLGDPLADLGWMLYFWRDPGEPAFDIPVANVTDEPGFSRRADLLARHAERFPDDVRDVRWYMALAGWKISIIMEGSYRRFLAGVADHPTFAALEEGVPALARRALAAARGDLGG